MFLQHIEEWSTERVVESGLGRIDWVLEVMLLQAWDQLYDCRNLDIKTGVHR